MPEPVAIRRMFSGHGISAEGITFALVPHGIVRLKVDETTQPLRGGRRKAQSRFSTRRGGRTVTVNSYWSLPGRLYGDPDELVQWARTAVAVAHRTAAAKAGRRRGGRKSQATLVR